MRDPCPRQHASLEHGGVDCRTKSAQPSCKITSLALYRGHELFDAINMNVVLPSFLSVWKRRALNGALI